MTIYAFTEYHNDWPAFINLSEQPDGALKVSVRMRGSFGKNYATIELTSAQAEELADAVYKHVYKDEATAPALPEVPAVAPADLSDEQIEILARGHGSGGWQTQGDMVKFAKAILAAAKKGAQ